MDSKYKWHFISDDFIEYAEKQLREAMTGFNYKSYITPHSEMRELLGRIIEELQYLEAQIKNLIFIAVEKNLYTGKTKFNFDNFIPASKIINGLRNILIDDEIANKLIDLMKFRNYIIHEHYLNNNQQNVEKYFPSFLFIIYEANDYISNVTNRIIGGATHIPNVFEVKV